jgi:cytochrome c553
MRYRPFLATTVFSVAILAPLPLALAEGIEEKVALCTGCHGPQGHSQVPENPILAAQHPGYLESALQAYLSGGRDYGIMKTLAGRLTGAEIKAISAYFAAQPPFRTQAKAPGDAARGETRTAVCASCHGADGNSTVPTNPNLAGQHARYLSNALKDYKSGRRSNAIMASMVAALSEQDIEDIAAYYAAQSVRPPSAGVHEPVGSPVDAETPPYSRKGRQSFAETATPRALAGGESL